MQRLLIRMANSLKAIVWAYIISIFLSAGLFTLLENHTFAEGLWWSCATALTIGYGDIAPITWPMRTIGLVFSHFWILLMVPLVIANLIVKIIQDRDTFTHDEQEEVKRNLRKAVSLLEEMKND